MAEAAADYSQIYEFLYRIERRISYLEKDAAFIEKKIAALDGKKSGDYNSMNEELKNLYSNISSLKNNFTQCTHAMTRLSKNLKDTIKKEDISTLNTQLEDIKFEEYVTPKDLERGV